MTETGLITLPLILLTAIVSYRGFKDYSFFESYKFNVDKVLTMRNYKVLLTSGFLHIGWFHLIFNMITFYFFSGPLELFIGGLGLLFIYFISLVGGNLLSLWINRNHSDYSAVGASGAVNGVVFASIAVFPNMGIGLFLLPIHIPAWAYGIIFVVYSIYGIRSKQDNVGHEAHLGGALIGMLTILVMWPESLTQNPLPILILTLPSLAFLILIAYKPHVLLVSSSYSKKGDHYSIDHSYNERRIREQSDIDRILEKIHQKGMRSLTAKEKEILERYSKASK